MQWSHFCLLPAGQPYTSHPIRFTSTYTVLATRLSEQMVRYGGLADRIPLEQRFLQFQMHISSLPFSPV